METEKSAWLFDDCHRHLNPLVRQIAIVSWHDDDLIGHAKTFDHLAERGVLSNEEMRRFDDNKKLRPSGVRFVRARHRDNATLMRGVVKLCLEPDRVALLVFGSTLSIGVLTQRVLGVRI